MSEVTVSAEPADMERAGVIVVMHLAVGFAALLAGHAGKFPPAQVDVGVGASVGSAALFVWEGGVFGSVGSLMHGVARLAVRSLFGLRSILESGVCGAADRAGMFHG
jgi:hypothetical protein